MGIFNISNHNDKPDIRSELQHNKGIMHQLQKLLSMDRQKVSTRLQELSAIEKAKLSKMKHIKSTPYFEEAYLVRPNRKPTQESLEEQSFNELLRSQTSAKPLFSASTEGSESDPYQVYWYNILQGGWKPGFREGATLEVEGGRALLYGGIGPLVYDSIDALTLDTQSSSSSS